LNGWDADSSRKGADLMKERLRDLLSEVGGSFDYLRSDVRNLSRYLAELEELVEVYRAFVSNTEFSTQADQVTRRKLLKKTQKVLGPPPDKPAESHDPDTDAKHRAAPLYETPLQALLAVLRA
jgi:hypothetical protein